jgi:hypothetical protein
MTKNKITMILLVILASSFVVAPMMPLVMAPEGVEITSVSPTSRHGKVGEDINIVGTVNTTDGVYRLFFNNQLVKESNADGKSINATFPAPHILGGNYTIILQDVAKNVNATTSFFIDTAYYIKAVMLDSPLQKQESNPVEIWVNVTGGSPNKVYVANVTVGLPSAAASIFWKLFRLSNTTSTGDGHNTTIVFPTSFSTGAHTNLTGTYSVAFNNSLATNTFFIGLTDRGEYHRLDNVNVKASGYKQNENVSVTIGFNKKIINSTAYQADSGGIVQASWTVPFNASIGVYTVNVTSTFPPASKTEKTPIDSQNFDVPGFDVNVTTKNLAGNSVPSVTVRVYEGSKSVSNVTTDSDGLATFVLEIGNYTVEAYYRTKKVGARDLIIANTSAVDLICNLTNLKVAIITEGGIALPEVEVLVVPENNTLTTDVQGTAVAYSLLPNSTYTLNSSRYGMLFNTTTISSLLVNNSPVAWFNLTIVCPTHKLQVSVTKTNGQPISDAVVKIQDLIGGLNNSASTDLQGTAHFNNTFGRYSVTVYGSDGIELNETLVDLFEDKNVTVVCQLYSLTVSIRVTDYFGQALSNVNVTLQREGLMPHSLMTQSDGTATFEGVTGGNMRAAVYLFSQGEPFVEGSLYVSEPTTINMKIDRFVSFGGFLVETSQLATILIIILSLVFIIIVDVYRRRRVKSKKTEE